MPTPSILVATWDSGLFNVTGTAVQQELADRTVRGLVADRAGGVLAIVDGHSLRRRSAAGEWTEIATSDSALSCCAAIGHAIFVGTDDARILRVDADGSQQFLASFDGVAGRDTWYAGSAVVDGRVVGPPLGIRSMAATCDDRVLLANVHVGGIPRSSDSGQSWQPTIDIDNDVHQVCAHPNRAEIVIAASARGLCISRDGGATWTIENDGLHAHHCLAVAFGTSDMFVSAATDPFAAQGAVYRRPIDGDGPLQRLNGGLPGWTDGRVDTDCIATRGALAAIVDGSGCLYVSHDDGVSWSIPADRLPMPSGLHIT